ncbi:hypothetical protein SARC_16686, partial [Sphaeroforma arctica JP610]
MTDIKQSSASSVSGAYETNTIAAAYDNALDFDDEFEDEMDSILGSQEVATK